MLRKGAKNLRPTDVKACMLELKRCHDNDNDDNDDQSNLYRTNRHQRCPDSATYSHIIHTNAL